ncbi:hypothetical protein TDB9533_04117 [Thalassocella blandensis]|nr:hypothetical protein TDB9533_04117 [Thalassocella blandensis]
MPFKKIIQFMFVVFVTFALSACAVKPESSASQSAKPVYYIYLAGPEVFLPEPIEAGEEKKKVIRQLNVQHNWPFTLVGLYPMDNEIPDFKPDRATGLVIYEENIKLMEKAHYIAANMVRFRGPSMDVGTAFEMGFMRGLGKPVYAYYESYPFYRTKEAPGLYVERVKTFYQVDPKNSGKDIHGQSIESFQMADNLMMIGALNDSKTQIKMTFSEVVEEIASDILAKHHK